MKNKKSTNTSINNTPITKFDLTLIANFFKSLNQQGPGGTEETLKALGFITNLPPKPKIADIGCGTGKQTSVLASNLDCTITAIDFLPEMIEGLNDRVKKDNLEQKVTAIRASMDQLPFQSNEFDLIWAEGSIYNIGFERGLTEWREYIKLNGFVAVTECSWLTNNRLDYIDYFSENHPEIDTISNKLCIMECAGYKPIAHFILPEYCWAQNFYAPMHIRMQEFLKENNNSEAAKLFVDLIKEEMAIYQQYKDYFGYVFYIGQKVD